ncbi:MAG: hypothetical protein HN356_00275 [Calditrichaeota bacterium]|jgi:nitrogen regulatory protein P-II 1|nr:hypothetical protein [Calditrichota bacterium]MBT7618818.1 hypothetical protein [Calditrichota bacterium]
MSKLKLVVIILNKEEFLDELLEGFLELDVRGATVIDSVGMGQLIANVPIFGGLRSLMSGARPYNKTILTVVDEEKIKPIIDVFEQICGCLDDPGSGLVFVLPVDYARGLQDKALS